MGAFQLTEMPGNTKINRAGKTNTTRACHNQNDRRGVLQTKELLTL